MRFDDGNLPELYWSKVTCCLNHLFTFTGKLKRAFAVSAMSFNPPNANPLLSRAGSVYYLMKHSIEFAAVKD